MTSQGTAHGRFTRAIAQRNLWAVESSLRELGSVSLEDALAYLGLLAEQKPEKLERAAVRWHGRLETEATFLTLAESQLALAALASGRGRLAACDPLVGVDETVVSAGRVPGDALHHVGSQRSAFIGPTAQVGVTSERVVGSVLEFSFAALELSDGDEVDRHAGTSSHEREVNTVPPAFPRARRRLGRRRGLEDRWDAEGGGRMRRAPLLLLVLGVALVLAPAAGASHAGAAAQLARIDHVADGDTVDLTNGAKVRLVQIDTPEVYFRAECYGKQASAITKRLLPPGTLVRLTREPKTDSVDSYGRLLRYVVRGHLNVNVYLVRVGAAAPYFYDYRRGRYASLLVRLARHARTHHLGLWGRCPGTPGDPYRGVSTGPP